MSRPRQFDEEQVLVEVEQAFIDSGYLATNIDHVLSRTGLARQSLYNAFGGKKPLFLRVLQRYEDRQIRRFQKTLESATSPIEGLKLLMVEALSEAAARGPRGCLLVSTAAEMRGLDSDIECAIEASRKRREELVTKYIRLAQRNLEISDDREPTVLARYVLACLAGMQMLGSSLTTEEQCQAMAEAVIRALE